MLEEEELKNTILLVFANKSDMKGAATEMEVSEALGLHAIKERYGHGATRRNAQQSATMAIERQMPAASLRAKHAQVISPRPWSLWLMRPLARSVGVLPSCVVWFVLANGTSARRLLCTVKA